MWMCGAELQVSGAELRVAGGRAGKPRQYRRAFLDSDSETSPRGEAGCCIGEPQTAVVRRCLGAAQKGGDEPALAAAGKAEDLCSVTGSAEAAFAAIAAVLRSSAECPSPDACAASILLHTESVVVPLLAWCGAMCSMLPPDGGSLSALCRHVEHLTASVAALRSARGPSLPAPLPQPLHAVLGASGSGAQAAAAERLLDAEEALLFTLLRFTADNAPPLAASVAAALQSGSGPEIIHAPAADLARAAFDWAGYLPAREHQRLARLLQNDADAADGALQAGARSWSGACAAARASFAADRAMQQEVRPQAAAEAAATLAARALGEGDPTLLAAAMTLLLRAGEACDSDGAGAAAVTDLLRSLQRSHGAAEQRSQPGAAALWRRGNGATYDAVVERRARGWLAADDPLTRATLAEHERDEEQARRVRRITGSLAREMRRCSETSNRNLARYAAALASTRFPAAVDQSGGRRVLRFGLLSGSEGLVLLRVLRELRHLCGAPDGADAPLVLEAAAAAQRRQSHEPGPPSVLARREMVTLTPTPVQDAVVWLRAAFEDGRTFAGVRACAGGAVASVLVAAAAAAARAAAAASTPRPRVVLGLSRHAGVLSVQSSDVRFSDHCDKCGCTRVNLVHVTGEDVWLCDKCRRGADWAAPSSVDWEAPLGAGCVLQSVPWSEAGRPGVVAPWRKRVVRLPLPLAQGYEQPPQQPDDWRLQFPRSASDGAGGGQAGGGPATVDPWDLADVGRTQGDWSLADWSYDARTAADCPLPLTFGVFRAYDGYEAQASSPPV